MTRLFPWTCRYSPNSVGTLRGSYGSGKAGVLRSLFRAGVSGKRGDAASCPWLYVSCGKAFLLTLLRHAYLRVNEKWEGPALVHFSKALRQAVQDLEALTATQGHDCVSRVYLDHPIEVCPSNFVSRRQWTRCQIGTLGAW